MKKALLISCFDWYGQRLAPLKELLENNYEITILLSDFDHINKREITNKRRDCIYIHVPSYEKNISLKRIFSHFEFGRNVRKTLYNIKPDFIYLVLPPNNTAFYCLHYKKKYPNVKYVIDIIDLWPESMPLNCFWLKPLKWAWKNMRDSSLKCADFVFTECGLYMEHLKPLLGKHKTKVNYLLKEQSEIEKLKVKKIISENINRAKNDNCITLAYLGSINNITDINKITLIIKWLQKKGNHISIKIIGDGANRYELEQKLIDTGAEVDYFGKIYDEIKKIEILGKCDFGLNIMKDSVAVGLTTKSIDYFSYGLPIINNIKGDTWELVEKRNMGVNFTNDIDRFFMDLKEFKANRNSIIECYNELFTKEAYQKNLKEFLRI